tara:strand:- start:60 stop:464 length:405 start_codon:yes stop_codon:yes gene_type:complete
MPHPKVKISDNSGNTVAVDTSGASNALKVALVAGGSIDIGDVEILGHGAVTSSDFIDIDNSSEQLPTGACKELILQADDANTGYIMIGSSTDVDADNGIKLNAGDVLTLPVTNRDLMWAWGSAADQKLRTMIVT